MIIRSVRGLAATLVWGSLALACIKVPSRADGGSPTADAGRSDGKAPADAAPIPTSCREIRVCVYACGQDKTCADRCAAGAPAAARAKYMMARSCSLQQCPDEDVICRCNEECYFGGVCYDLVDECDEGVSDPFCDIPCH